MTGEACPGASKKRRVSNTGALSISPIVRFDPGDSDLSLPKGN
jgi:hypothetical protein